MRTSTTLARAVDQIAGMILAAIIAGLAGATGATVAARRSYRGMIEAAARSAAAVLAAAETSARAAREVAAMNERSARAVAEISRQAQLEAARDTYERDYRQRQVRGILEEANRSLVGWRQNAINVRRNDVEAANKLNAAPRRS